MEVVDLAMLNVQPLRKGSVLDCLTDTSMYLGDSREGMKVISRGQRWTEGSKVLPLQVNSLERKKAKKAKVKAAHNIMWSILILRGGW